MVVLKDKGSEALEELMNQAQMIATAAIRGGRQMEATLFLHGQEGNAILVPQKFDSEEAKDRFAEVSRIMCVAQGADAVVYCSEAWMVSPKKDKPLDLSVAPSKSPDRQEVLVLMGETREGCLHRSLPIHRAEGGKFAGFGEMTEIRPDSVGGRFANFLPELTPTEEDRRLAKLYLAAKGIVPEEKRDKYREQGRAMY